MMTRHELRRLARAPLLAGVLASTGAAAAEWEYQVAIVHGITAGGTIERKASGYFVDVKKTQILNALAADGWDVVAVVGGSATEHVIYLRRRR